MKTQCKNTRVTLQPQRLKILTLVTNTLPAAFLCISKKKPLINNHIPTSEVHNKLVKGVTLFKCLPSSDGRSPQKREKRISGTTFTSSHLFIFWVEDAGNKCCSVAGVNLSGLWNSISGPIVRILRRKENVLLGVARGVDVRGGKLGTINMDCEIGISRKVPGWIV